MRVRGGGEEGMRMCVCCVRACVYAGGWEGQMEEEGKDRGGCGRIQAIGALILSLYLQRIADRKQVSHGFPAERHRQ